MTSTTIVPPSSSVPSAAELRIVPATKPQSVPPAGRPVPAAPAHARRSRWRWIATIIVACALAAAAIAWRASQPVSTIRYVTARVTRGPVTRGITASGSVNPVTTIQVGTYVSGVIQELYCDYNTQVHQGQLCARIDPRPYQTAVDQDRANLATARAQLAKDRTSLTYAKLTYDRAVDLRAQGIVTQDSLDASKSAYDQAAAQVDLDASNIDQHQAALKAAEINLAYTNIVSPVTGTVVARNVTMGQTVAASFQTPTLFLIATDLTKMQVDANVSESDIGGIALDNASTFTVEAFPDRVFEGRVVQVRQAPQTVQNVVTYDVVISVANPELLLKPGMTATTRIAVDHRDNVLRVPDQALRYTPGGVTAASGSGEAAAARAQASRTAQVWILRDGQPARVPVVVGLDDDTYTEVRQGELKPGDDVVVAEQQASTPATSASRLRFFRF